MTRRAQPWAMGACVVYFLAAGPAPPETPILAVTSVGPADSSVRVLQLNLCASGHARCYTGRAVQKAAGVIRAEAPDVVTLNEVCEGDVSLLEQVMADGRPGGVVSAFQAAVDARTRGAIRCRNDRPYGIGLVMRLSSARSNHAGGGTYPMQDRSRVEERVWLCMMGAAFTACTTHLASSSPVVARAQCDYLLHTVIPTLPAEARTDVVLAGDFNLRSDGAPDMRSCLPYADRGVDDGDVQHVIATPGFTIAAKRSIGMSGTTDHPALCVTLIRP